MVSAELALAVPAVLLVLAICLTALALGVDQVRVTDAARVGARAASRGEDAALVRQLTLDRAPDGSRVVVGDSGDGVVVTVLAPARTRLLPGLPGASGVAQARWEPGARP